MLPYYNWEIYISANNYYPFFFIFMRFNLDLISMSISAVSDVVHLILHDSNISLNQASISTLCRCKIELTFLNSMHKLLHGCRQKKNRMLLNYIKQKLTISICQNNVHV